mmetsp:Transcript_43899/g.70544  ORF Transcript_43899/g.70544 Transcript_43899/m.70544 type:complete len:221 (-) Transcript_43899:4340-5002(-)
MRRDLFLIAFLFVRHEGVHLAGVVPHELDDVRRGVVHEAVHPRNLKHHVRAEQVIARVQARSEALLVLLLDKELQQALSNCAVARVRRCLHGVFEEAVLLGELHTLLPAQVLLVNVAGNASELHELVLLAAQRQAHLVEVVKHVDGLPQRLEVLLINAELVDGVVHCCQVGVLHCHQVGLDERQVPRLAHKVHHARVVDPRREHCQQVVELRGVVLEVEG